MGSIKSGPTLAVIPGWRIGILLALFFLVASFYHWGVARLETYFRRKNKRGLRNVVSQLNTEILILGLISLLLIAFEQYFLLICIPCSGDTCYWDCENTIDNAQNARESAAQIVEGDAEDSSSISQTIDCLEVKETCPEGQEPFWSATAIMQAHILIFTIAIVHIFYVAISIILCLSRMNKWKKYEEEAQYSMIQKLQSRFIFKPGDNFIAHWSKCFVMTFTYRITAPLYRALRRLFIERLDLEPDFNFHAFLIESIEEAYAEIIGMEWMMWIILLMWVMLPAVTRVRIWLGGLAVLVVLVVAVKMQDIVIQLAVDAYKKYGNQSMVFARRRRGGGGSGGPPVGLSCRSMEVVEMAAKKHFPHGADNGGSGSLGDSNNNGTHSIGRAIDTTTAAAATGVENKILHKQTSSITTRGLARSQSQLVRFAIDASSSDEEEDDIEVDNEDANAYVGVVLEEEKQSTSQAVSANGSGSVQVDPRRQEHEHEQQVGFHQPHQPAVSPFMLEEHNTTSSGQNGDVEAPPVQRTAINGIDNSNDNSKSGTTTGNNKASSTSSWRTKTKAGCGKLACWKPKTQGAYFYKKGLQKRAISISFSERYKCEDAANLFWFGSPKLVTRLIQFAYFENSLSIATFLFSLWQDLDYQYSDYGGWWFVGVTIAINVFVLFFLSLAVLPVYALTTAVGSHTPASVIRMALKNKFIDPDAATALQETLLNPYGPAGDDLFAGLTGTGDTTAVDVQSSTDASSALGLQHTLHTGEPEISTATTAVDDDANSRSIHHPGHHHRSASTTAATPAVIAVPAGPPVLRKISAPSFRAGAGTAGGGPQLGRLSLTRLSAAGNGTGTGGTVVGSSVQVSGVATPYEEQNQQSVTRLLGSMYARQAQKYLERVSAPEYGGNSGAGTAGVPPSSSSQQQQQQRSEPQGRRPTFQQLSTLMSEGWLDEPEEPGEEKYPTLGRGSHGKSGKDKQGGK
jgi:hypothetical protein